MKLSRRSLTELVQAVFFAVLIFFLLIPTVNSAVIRSVISLVAIGSWYAGRRQMEYLGFGGLLLFLLRELEQVGIFDIHLLGVDRVLPPLRAVGLGIAFLFILGWVALRIAERSRLWFMLAVLPLAVWSGFLISSPFVFRALRFVCGHYWFLLAALTVGKRRAEQEGRSWLVAGLIPLVWSPRWVPIPVLISGNQFLASGEESRRLRWQGLGLIILSSVILYFEKKSRAATGGDVRLYWQWFLVGSFQANQAVGLAWVAGMRLGLATGNFLATSSLSECFRTMIRYYSDALEQFFIAPLFARLRWIRTFHWRVFVATFFGIFVGGFYIHLTTVLLLRKEFRFPLPGMRMYSLYPYENWRLPIYFLFIALAVSTSSLLQARNPTPTPVSLPRRVIFSVLYFLAFSFAVMFGFYPEDLTCHWILGCGP